MTDSGFTYNSVLLVDDSEIDVLVNRRLMELTSFAARITVTSSGEEALHYLREECGSASSAPDWIFLDMHLPMMNGYDFIEEFRNLPGFITGKTRIIILSVMPNPEQLKKVFQYEFMFDQIDKPLTREALLTLKQVPEKLNVSSGKNQ
ncbi:MAG: response regulator [Bacteroidia bacterium]|nr:response regulator [Bacteroidia bacterium]